MSPDALFFRPRHPICELSDTKCDALILIFHIAATVPFKCHKLVCCTWHWLAILLHSHPHRIIRNPRLKITRDYSSFWFCDPVCMHVQIQYISFIMFYMCSKFYRGTPVFIKFPHYFYLASLRITSNKFRKMWFLLFILMWLWLYMSIAGKWYFWRTERQCKKGYCSLICL